MQYPHFFETVETIKLKDELSEVLGAFSEGILEISYLDVVKNAGHSCPTTAGAYLMAREGLKELYQGAIAKRGDVKVYFKEAIEEGTTGVSANIFSLITGATDVWGFKGLGNHYIRKNLMFFQADIPLYVRLQRADTGAMIDMAYHPNRIEADVTINALMPKIITENANQEEKKQFMALWQARVQNILENFDKVIDYKID
ncbi:MAG: hypothetical protein PHR87_02020 [Sulfurospirillaceae bacterium]|nr:hypothetical protein [Sulfurospirillaceae bacterium]